MIFSLDIGSSKIVSLVGSIGDGVEVNGVSSYYFVNSSKTNDFLSVNNGVVCDLEKVGIRVTQALNEARINADCSTGAVLCNIAGNSVGSVYTTAKTELTNQMITHDILHGLVQNARQFELPKQFETLDYEIQEYVLDKENYTLNPLHLTASMVEANVNHFIASITQIANLKNVVRYSGFNLARLVPSGILSGMAVLNNEEKELGCCLVDIGAGTTDIVVYENGFIRYLCSVPIGGENLTRDIASVLKISRNLAEDIKLHYGGCSYVSSAYKFGEGIAITDHRGLNTTISRKLLIDVIVERLKDIFAVIKTTLEKQGLYDIINSGIVLTGGTALLPNLEELARQYFALPVKVGVPAYSGDFADVVAAPQYATSLGALYFANQYLMDEVLEPGRAKSINLRGLFHRMKGLFAQ
jgi:cell division protein FtsA